jgi:hypothetical protein
MARELRASYPETGVTITAKVYLASGPTLTGTVTLAEDPASSMYYGGDFPAAAAGTYDVLYFVSGVCVQSETIQWDGTAVLSNATTADVTILPVASTVSTGEVSTSALVAYQNEDKTFTFGVVDADGDPIDLTGKTVTFYAAYRGTQNTPVITRTTTGSAGVTVGGDDGNSVAVALTDTHTANLARFVYALWNVTDDYVLARGTLEVLPAPQAVA